jgi:hypothetical protein
MIELHATVAAFSCELAGGENQRLVTTSRGVRCTGTAPESRGIIASKRRSLRSAVHDDRMGQPAGMSFRPTTDDQRRARRVRRVSTHPTRPPPHLPHPTYPPHQPHLTYLTAIRRALRLRRLNPMNMPMAADAPPPILSAMTPMSQTVCNAQNEKSKGGRPKHPAIQPGSPGQLFHNPAGSGSI